MTAEGAHAAVHGESPLVFVQILGSSQAGLVGADFSSAAREDVVCTVLQAWLFIYSYLFFSETHFSPQSMKHRLSIPSFK